MNFQRARTDEQRSERRRQILATAAAMLTEMPAAKLSLNELSRRACLAKANVLRYFESREAILLDLLDAEVRAWVVDLERREPEDGRTVDDRTDRVADVLAESLAARPVLCDLASSQAAVLEHNISADVAVRHKYAARESMGALRSWIVGQIPELGESGAGALVETTLMIAMTAWPCSRPSDAMLAAYASDPELDVMRVNFTDVVRRTARVTIVGLLVGQGVIS